MKRVVVQLAAMTVVSLLAGCGGKSNPVAPAPVAPTLTAPKLESPAANAQTRWAALCGRAAPGWRRMT
jgi:hypothetical protein